MTHSTVAALTHTLAHSPLHDSFCMMCYQFQKQCEFCHFNQQKIMYGLYYSHYFSTYYSGQTGARPRVHTAALLPRSEALRWW